jgi:hypothetical protein
MIHVDPMIWEVRLSKRVIKHYPEPPVNIQERFKALELRPGAGAAALAALRQNSGPG